MKRQAEAAELHERIERQVDEARWTLARDGSRIARAALVEAEKAVGEARAAAQAAEAEFEAVGKRRQAAEEALSARSTDREALSARFYAARSSSERISMRLDAAGRLISELRDRIARRSVTISRLESEAAADTGDEGAAERITALQTELGQLAEDHRVRLERELTELEERRTAAAAVVAEKLAAAGAAAATRTEAEKAVDAARAARRELDTTAEKARRDSARIGAELAKVNQFLRANAGAPGGAAALADTLSAAPGYELALTAALGPRLRAAVAADLTSGAALLSRAGKDGAAALIVPETARADSPAAPTPGDSSISVGPSAVEAAMPLPRLSTFPGSTSFPVREEAAPDTIPAPAPAATAERLSAHVKAAGDDGARRLASALLDDVWVVESVEGLDPDFRGVAVTKDGRVWSPGTRELRQVSPGGQDRVLSERNRRDALVKDVELTAQAERHALNAVEAAQARIAEADHVRDEKDQQARAAARARDEAVEAERHVRYLIEQRKAAPAEGATAERKAQLESAIATERRLIERADRERQERTRRLEHEQRKVSGDQALLPTAERFAAALGQLTGAVANQVEALEAELNADRAAAESLTTELRECAAAESQVHARMRERGEAVTRGEVQAQRARDHAQDAETELTALATKLGLPPEPSVEPSARPGARHAEHAHRAPAAPARAARPGQPARAGRVQGSARARAGARASARGPRDRAARAADVDPRHRPPDQGGLRGDVHRRRGELRGGRRPDVPGRQGRPAARARGRRPAPRARRPGGGARPRSPRKTRRRPRTTWASRSRSRPPASPPSASRCSAAARSR